MSIFAAIDGFSSPDSLGAFLRASQSRFGDKLAIASSLGAEDVILVRAAAELARQGGAAIRIFILDTGRLPEATYELHEALEARYGLRIESIFPDTVGVQTLVRGQGMNGFMHSLEARHRCCGVRKLEPLGRALEGVDAWITGLRRAQSASRTTVELAEQDGARVKLNPLAHWSDDEVWSHIRDNNIPYSALHDRGYPSVGCEPCTRAVEPGAHPRSGRWWWEDPQHNECGLHVARIRRLKEARNADDTVVERGAEAPSVRPNGA